MSAIRSTPTLVNRRLLRAGLLAASLLASPARAWEAPPELDAVTVLIAPAKEEPGLAEATARVAAELGAAGFRVAAGGCAPGLHPDCRRPWPEDARAVAAVGFAWNGSALAIETRVARAPHARPVRLETQIAGTPAPEPSVVAVRTTELVRAGVLAVMRAEATASVQAGSPERAPPSGLFVELGPALVQSVSGLGSAWGPSLRTGFAWRESWFVAGWLVAPAVGGETRASPGSAELRTDLGGLELGRRFRAGPLLRPTLALAAGAYRLEVEGRQVEPLVPATDALVTPFVAAGAGLAIALGRHWTCQADARALFVKTSPAVRIGGEEAGRTGWPLLVFGLGLGFHQ